MPRSVAERPGRWALPPQLPDRWPGGTESLLLVVAAGLAVALPSVLVFPGAGAAATALAALLTLGGLACAGLSYTLTVQAVVTQDLRLAWAAGGCALLLLVELGRSAVRVLPGETTDPTRLRVAAALSVLWLLTLPAVALGTVLRRRGAGWFAVPLLLLLATAGAAAADGSRSDQDLAVPGLLLAVGAALHWRRRVPFGNRGAWGWFGALLLLLPLVAVLRLLDLTWAALAVEDVVLTVPAVGLALLTARGWSRQRRAWSRLEAEVRRQRASSALLPGLSVAPDDEAPLPERSELCALLAQGRPGVALQPVHDLATGAPVGQEALARFPGALPPDRWFRAAALHGLGSELEQLALAAALAALTEVPDDVFLAVNVSPASLRDDAALAVLHAADLSRVVVEVTEHDAVPDGPALRQALRGLRRAGARIAVDDVGAGFASLHHVLLLQPDVVKLDAGLCREVAHSPRQQAVVAAVVAFAAEVGATVVAEGIELEEQVQALRAVGVPLGQGWHLGRPVLLVPDDDPVP